MGATTQNQRRDSAGRKSLAKHAGRKFLTNPDASGKIGNNREGELAIGNYRELSGIIGTRFLPIFPDNSQLGKVGSDRECRISVSGIAIILQIFSQMPDSRFFAECPSDCKCPLSRSRGNCAMGNRQWLSNKYGLIELSIHPRRKRKCQSPFVHILSINGYRYYQNAITSSYSWKLNRYTIIIASNEVAVTI
jgi:hypothetical protein